MIRCPDYFVTKPVRSACWVLAALLFYALFTRELLSQIALNEEADQSFFSAWIAVGRSIWNEPGKIVHVGYEDFGAAMISALIGAVIGSLPMLFLAVGRKGYLLGPILVLTIPFAWISALFIQFRIGLGLDDLATSTHRYSTDALASFVLFCQRRSRASSWLDTSPLRLSVPIRRCRALPRALVRVSPETDRVRAVT